MAHLCETLKKQGAKRLISSSGEQSQKCVRPGQTVTVAVCNATRGLSGNVQGLEPSDFPTLPSTMYDRR